MNTSEAQYEFSTEAGAERERLLKRGIEGDSIGIRDKSCIRSTSRKE